MGFGEIIVYDLLFLMTKLIDIRLRYYLYINYLESVSILTSVLVVSSAFLSFLETSLSVPSPLLLSRLRLRVKRALCFGGGNCSIPRTLWIWRNATRRSACWADAVMSSRCWAVIPPIASTGSFSQGSARPVKNDC